MPTFKKSKGLKGQFENADVTNAVKDVMHHDPSLREAGRRRNVNLEQPKFLITASLLIFGQYRIFALGINLKAFLFSKVNYFRMPFS